MNPSNPAGAAEICSNWLSPGMQQGGRIKPNAGHGPFEHEHEQMGGRTPTTRM